MSRLIENYLPPILEDGLLTAKKMGYASGGVVATGGAVTQATNRTTGVTLNTVCGTITLHLQQKQQLHSQLLTLLSQ
jgi:hypothetical protein